MDDKMTEHVHGWSIASRNGHEAKFRCKFWDCAETLAPEQVKARLNATERLDIGEIKKWVTAQHILDMLQDVANILEGKDE